MSRKLNSENFVKEQLLAFCKALSKAEAPIKQKHVRALIVGTHKQHSARIFWHGATRIQLEKNPVLTWKFCHLLHKLIRDGHRKVTDDSIPYCSRLVQLGNFWQHLRTSGYGMANTTYCKLLNSRLKFHKKYPSIVGSLSLAPNQLNALMSDLNETFELAIDILDQMDELLGLKATVMNIMDSCRWSSLIPQGQCLLAPLILVILDTSKFYDFLVKVLFKLHSRISPDTLTGHRERFYETFRKTRKFYEEATSLQYFKYLVSVPTLPSAAPNFLQASDLETYQSPQAYLRTDGSSESGGDVTPPDSQSICEDTIIDLSTDDSAVQQLMNDEAQFQSTSFVQNQQQQLDEKDEIINNLRQEINVERQYRETLVNETRLRFEQYEQRLSHMRNEMEEQKVAQQTLDESRNNEQQNSNDAHAELEREVVEKEQKFVKIKSIYDNLRQEHISCLTELRDLRTKTKAQEAELSTKSEELAQATQSLNTLKHDQNVIEERAQTSSASLDSERQKRVEFETQLSDLTSALERMKEQHTNKNLALEKSTSDRIHQLLGGAFTSALLILEQGQEDLLNVTSISYPTHLAADSLRNALDFFDNQFVAHLKSTVNSSLTDEKFVRNLVKYTPVFANKVVQTSIISAAAAYTTSIEFFEPVNEQCRNLLAASVSFYEKLRVDSETHDSLSYDESFVVNVQNAFEKLEELVKALPTSKNVENTAESIGAQLEEEMRRMDSVIQKSVEQIELLQKKARENLSGVRLEVNDNILEQCTSLMEAVRSLVSRSRDVQDEVVASGRGFASSGEFYKRNHLWTDGLLSAASAVGVAATVLVNSADGVISGTSKFEHLIVAAQEIAASVAQLFVSSRVKADKNSEKMAQLASASKNVNTCTAAVVAASKSAQQSLADDALMDFTRLSLHDAKKEEMECQVRTLELEADLGRERAKLAQLRKQHYHLASLVANGK